MTKKLEHAKRYAAAAVTVADKASVAWSAWIATNAIVVWGAQMMFSAPAMPPANDNEAVEPPVAASSLVQPQAAVPAPAERVAPSFDLSPIAVPQATSDPAQAVWVYLCAHDATLSETARALCPVSAEPLALAPSPDHSFDTYEKHADPFAWSERLNAANDNHHIVQED